MQKITLTFYGTRLDQTPADKIITAALSGRNESAVLEGSYVLSSPDRAATNTFPVEIKDNDKILEFTFEDDTTWICDASTLDELFPDIDNRNRGIVETYVVPQTLEQTSNERGIISGIALKLLSVFIKKKVPGKVKEIATKLEDKLLPSGEGLFSLQSNFTPALLKKLNTSKPILLFVHGTNSNTAGAFSKLLNSDAWKYMTAEYGENIIAFEHRTLTKSPLTNVTELVTQLPDVATIHIISHSRGGLIGEILSNYSADKTDRARGFTDDQVQLLKKYKRKKDLADISKLNAAFKNKKITIEKFIRIGCPAGGTRLASKRLDIIFNVFYNIFGRELNPFVGLIKDLITETLRTKDNIEILPGLEAQGPGSPFIEVLNDMSGAGLPGGSLSVISGNGKLSGSLDGLFFILGRLFFWQRNDLVVNTDSMYLGAKRTDKIQYFFDQGPEVDHFKYFQNNTSREAIALALKTPAGAPIPGFTSHYQYEIPASDRGIAGIEYGELVPDPDMPTGKKPILVLIPGIMGSNLSSGGRRIWLAYREILNGALSELDINDPAITAGSVLSSSYEKLTDHFSGKYDVVIYPFDWRQQLNKTAEVFAQKIEHLLTFNQPIKIIGHSMGGVLVRDFIITQPKTWAKLNASKDFRLLYLGAPLGGSFRILTVMFGNDSIINTLNFLDRRHTKKELIDILKEFPGILSLLPLTTDTANDFANRETWVKMADTMGDTSWPIPSDERLAEFRAYRDQVIARQDKIDYTNSCYIAGKGKFTPSGYYNDVIPPRTELVFLGTGEGDESVTWSSAIPKQLAKTNSVYYVDTTHGALADEPDLFDGINEILEKGNTFLLSKAPPPSTRGSNNFRLPETFNFDYSERGVGNAIFGRGKPSIPVSNNLPLLVSVSNGNLAYTSFPLIIGHFENDGILYSERAADKLMHGGLSARHQLNLYPGPIGSNTVVLPVKDKETFPGAIVVGLGEPGTLTTLLLAKTIEQGVSKYLLNINDTTVDQADIGISSLMVGCGYGGLSLENSIKAIIEGITNANKKIKAISHDKMNIVKHLEFIEILEDRALACLYTLNTIETNEKSLYNFTIANNYIKKLFGLRKRMPTNSREEWWNRITVQHGVVTTGEKLVPALIFNSSTRLAREEEKPVFTNTRLLDQFIEQISSQNRWTPDAAKALFELMIPNEFKDRLKSKGNINWVLDTNSAAYPWELLQEKSANAKPLCIGGGMIRQLKTPNYKNDRKRVATELALIVGDPLLNGYAGQLDGARDEALKVQDLLTQHEFPCITRVNTNNDKVTEALFGNDFKVMHLASHGVYNPTDPSKSGMVIGNGIFLTTAEFAQLEVTPELVFINCCHLGKHVPEGDLTGNRFRLAANIGTTLIESGVKAVIAAGWAVNDQAAHDFATVFYTSMLAGNNFGESVTAARSLLYEKHKNNNTWGAYQCYGDPFYKLVNRTSASQMKLPKYAIEEEALVDLNNLRNELDTRNSTTEEALRKLERITEAVQAAEFKSAMIKEYQTAIKLELGEYDNAFVTYKEMMDSDVATFSVAAIEQFCNLRSKRCVAQFKATGKDVKYETEMKEVIAMMDQLSAIRRTPERLSILGSSYKRFGMISEGADKIGRYRQAAECYKEAYDKKQMPYSLNNWVVLVSILDLVEPGNKIFSATDVKSHTDVIVAAKAKMREGFLSMDYWDMIQEIAFDISLVFLGHIPSTPATWESIYSRFAAIWKKAGAKGRLMAELENLDILSDMLAIGTDQHSAILKKEVDTLKIRLAPLVK